MTIALYVYGCIVFQFVSSSSWFSRFVWSAFCHLQKFGKFGKNLI